MKLKKTKTAGVDVQTKTPAGEWESALEDQTPHEMSVAELANKVPMLVPDATWRDIVRLIAAGGEKSVDEKGHSAHVSTTITHESLKGMIALKETLPMGWWSSNSAFFRTLLNIGAIVLGNIYEERFSELKEWVDMLVQLNWLDRNLAKERTRQRIVQIKQAVVTLKASDARDKLEKEADKVEARIEMLTRQQGEWDKRHGF